MAFGYRFGGKQKIAHGPAFLLLVEGPQGYQILYRLPRLALRLLSFLPLRSLHALGTVLGWIIYGTSPTYRRRLAENLALAGYADRRTRRAAVASAGQML